jgi:hypothetical protein
MAGGRAKMEKGVQRIRFSSIKWSSITPVILASQYYGDLRNSGGKEAELCVIFVKENYYM